MTLRLNLLLLVSVVAVVSCGEQEQSLTAQDASAMGMVATRCPDLRSVPIYVEPNASPEGVVSYCDGVQAALAAAESSGLVGTDGISLDSIRTVVVELDRYAGTSRRRQLAPDSALSITIDLVAQVPNLLVLLPGPRGETEVTWVQEGLRY
jgi:hypothetical protein